MLHFARGKGETCYTGDRTAHGKTARIQGAFHKSTNADFVGVLSRRRTSAKHVGLRPCMVRQNAMLLGELNVLCMWAIAMADDGIGGAGELSSKAMLDGTGLIIFIAAPRCNSASSCSHSLCALHGGKEQGDDRG
eukprot:355369-Chlamydomonas_euryale.AAC.10